MDFDSIINKYYIPNSPLYDLLMKHSRQVANFAMVLIQARDLEGSIDSTLVYEAAMLHDIGVFRTHAPSILCNGTEHYMRHGIIGAEILRSEGPQWEAHARVCETHIGVGLTIDEIQRQNLPLPLRDFRPTTLEEKLVCYADNFFSKSHIAPAATIESVRNKVSKFGNDNVERFNQLVDLFGYI